MKKLSFFNKILFIINTIFAIALIFAIFLPGLSPNKFGVFSLFSIVVPAVIIVNILFVIYWIVIGFKKQLLQSFIVLIISYLFIPQLYKFNDNINQEDSNTISLMSFNVRKFNMYKWIKVDDIESKIKDFIENEDPDILALQEYRIPKNFKLKYPYFSNPPAENYSDSIQNSKHRIALGIYSKYPIVKEGIIKYARTSSAAMFIDVLKNKDTIRIYTFHMASLGIVPNQHYFGHDDSEKLVKKVRQSFKVQQQQIDSLNKHINTCKHKVIVTGDLNNTAYSWAYNNVRKNFKDTYLEAGQGFGTTYKFNKFPLRIDYIFVDNHFKVKSHKNYDIQLSDHYPVMATLKLKD
ncbi:endonuclease/exonuclease/phosphatase family protein [Aureibaculum sp. A20]|uniref:Endonuclease/exonuclease/phosphatase family protein n=1 Tax=Aureibaculum flavum TaxID=2795986 RepID=A0ABS0WTH4_9FLAO|nr:endonuclease/exonuclease/phosphatase family protein [Aureibaculum flavum]MBJ2175268.1 endonuclease/exonuclease/phosphatase family protein [Aureibaculum flavum]